MTNRVLFLDLLRCLAALTVVAIHVLAPYRHELGLIPLSEWSVAVTINGSSRWAVPVFIMVAGALLLSDPRPFDLRYYLSRRVAKVVIPFIIWSIFYAFLSGYRPMEGIELDTVIQTLRNSAEEETYYHLGFFYYFIPLYFIAPFLQAYVKNSDNGGIFPLLVFWLITTGFYLLRFDGPWSHPLWLYSGYLLLGYVLYKRIELNQKVVAFSICVGLTGIALSVSMVLKQSLVQEQYTVGRWLSYKTINTVAVATMVFVCCRYFAPKIVNRCKHTIEFISRHSLGIYLVHPLFLWPMKEWEWHLLGHPILVIPLGVFLGVCGSLSVSWLFARTSKTAWLLP